YGRVGLAQQRISWCASSRLPSFRILPPSINSLSCFSLSLPSRGRRGQRRGPVRAAAHRALLAARLRHTALLPLCLLQGIQPASGAQSCAKKRLHSFPPPLSPFPA